MMLIQTVGCFTAEVSAGGRKMGVEFVVIEEKGEPLMSKETAQALGILHIGLGVNSMMSKADLKREFERVFRGVGSYKAVKLN